jgi:hypothetical protein
MCKCTHFTYIHEAFHVCNVFYGHFLNAGVLFLKRLNYDLEQIEVMQREPSVVVLSKPAITNNLWL